MARAMEITHLDGHGFMYSRHVEKLEDTYMRRNASWNEIYKACQREFGRCMSRVYVDKGAPPRPVAVGWIFHKKVQYEDTQGYYLRETWVIIGEFVPPRPEGVTP